MKRFFYILLLALASTFHACTPRPEAVQPATTPFEMYWKSHATLTLLAKQDCPLWLQYD